MKTSLCSLFILALLFFAGCEKETSTPDPVTPTGTAPAFDTGVPSAPESVNETGFRIVSTLKENGGKAITQHGHVWSDTKPEPTTADPKSELGATGGPFPLKFTSEAKNLKGNTSFYVRPYATNEKGTAYGAVVQVKTTSEAFDRPVVEIKPVSNVGASAVTLNASVTKPGNKPVQSYGFAWSDTDPNPRGLGVNSKSAGTTIPSGTVPFNYKLDVKDLKANTKYYVRAYLNVKVNDNVPTPTYELIESAVETFTTLPNATLSGSWKAVSGFNTGLYGIFKSVQHENIIYEGRYFSGGFTTYDLATQKTTLNATPSPSLAGQFHNIVLVNKKIYLLMHYTSSSSKPDNIFWVYGIEDKKWTKKADFTGIPRADGKALAINGKLYFGGGNEYTTKNGTATTLKDWWEYNPADDKWTQKADLPVAKYDLEGFVSGSKAYLGMGLSFAGGTANNQESWFEYNPAANSWKTLKNFAGDYLKAGVVFQETPGDKNYALLLNKARTKYLMWTYDTAADAWSVTAELPYTPKSSSDLFWSFMYNNKLHIASNQNKVLFEFTP